MGYGNSGSRRTKQTKYHKQLQIDQQLPLMIYTVIQRLSIDAKINVLELPLYRDSLIQRYQNYTVNAPNRQNPA